MIGACDNCSRDNVPVSHGFFCGMETTQCYLCQGEDDPDPYCELDELTEQQHAKRLREALIKMHGA